MAVVSRALDKLIVDVNASVSPTYARRERRGLGPAIGRRLRPAG